MSLSPVIYLSPTPTAEPPYIWLSLDSMAQDFEYAQDLVLRGSGCGDPGYPGFTTNNCSATCSHPEQIFGSPATFESCLAYPSITRALGGPLADHLSDVGPGTVWGIQPNDTAGADAVVDAVTSCLRGWTGWLSECPGDEGCPLTECEAFLGANGSTGFPVGNSSPDAGPTISCVAVLCSKAIGTDPLDADVAGPGVRTSAGRRAERIYGGTTDSGRSGLCVLRDAVCAAHNPRAIHSGDQGSAQPVLELGNMRQTAQAGQK